MSKQIAEHTARFDIAALRTFGRSAPPPEGVITPLLLKAADDMEQMLEELLELRKKDALRTL